MKVTIEKGFAEKPDELDATLENALGEFLAAMNEGEVRAAEPTPAGWRVNDWVKKGILLLFRYGKMTDMSIDKHFRFFDKATIPLKPLRADDGVRIVPGGSSIRTGAHLARGVIMMPPSYVNIGAYIGENSLIDSHVLVGSCAQIGANVHLSAGVQIGGVLEPIGSLPVIVGDQAMIGGNCGIFEGTIIGDRAVIGTGVSINRSTPVFDCVNETVLRAPEGKPLEIPANAVVVPGSRPVSNAFGRENGLSITTPLIIKYRDEKTDAATALEEALR